MQPNKDLLLPKQTTSKLSESTMAESQERPPPERRFPDRRSTPAHRRADFRSADISSTAYISPAWRENRADLRSALPAPVRRSRGRQREAPDLLTQIRRAQALRADPWPDPALLCADPALDAARRSVAGSSAAVRGSSTGSARALIQARICASADLWRRLTARARSAIRPSDFSPPFFFLLVSISPV
ncbi:Uncharacterized protein Adt_28548 [Abeliophyllum distichum]|uniref:Uncharacterized protein n=1 Tax=Abeliophyllum distichum TaxID=126358 RepID=A0ABD1RWV5_9LAMI